MVGISKRCSGLKKTTLPLFVMFLALTIVIHDASARGCSKSGRSDVIGVNINNLSITALRSKNLITALRKSNVGWVRTNFYWSKIEPTEGNFNWLPYDEGIATLRANGIAVLVTLYGPVPCWAVRAGGTPCTTPQWTVPAAGPWGDFVRAAAERYRGKVNHWEIWNEPNLPYTLKISDPNDRIAAYRDDILIPAASAVRIGNPTARVIAGAFAAGTGGAETPDKLASLLKTLLTPEARKNIDGVSFHVYAPNEPAEFARAAREALDELGMKKSGLWLTETGALVSRIPKLPAGLVGQEPFLNGQFARAYRSHLYAKMFWFALTDSSANASDHSNSYGLIDNSNYQSYEWTPRPSFDLLRSFALASCNDY